MQQLNSPLTTRNYATSTPFDSLLIHVCFSFLRTEFENEILAIRVKRQNLAESGPDGEEGENGEAGGKKGGRVGLTDVGVYDTEFYSGEKSKFEGYHTSVAVADDAEVRVWSKNYSLSGVVLTSARLLGG